MSLLHLRKAYLQIHVDKALWSFQTVLFKGQRYGLRWQDFRLNVVCLIDSMMSQDKVIQNTMATYVDIYVNESLVSEALVRNHLLNYVLVCKNAEQLEDRTKVPADLGKEQHSPIEVGRWFLNDSLPKHVLRGQRLVSYFAVCGWLRVATAFIKQQTSTENKG